MREPAADKLGDFERTHPDAAHLVNIDHSGQRLFLLRRPGRGRRSPGAGQFRMAVAAQFFNRVREWKMFAHGGFDDFEQPGKRVFKGNGGKLNFAFLGNGVRRRDRGAGNRNARPPAGR